MADQTIKNFGDQWLHYTESTGYYGSRDFLKDVFGPLLSLDEIRDQRVIDVGSGTGRIVDMLLAAGAARVIAVEPSQAFSVLQQNLAHWGDRVTMINGTAEKLPASVEADLVVSIGVIHHIADPVPTLRAIHSSLRKGGRVFFWLYGKEGNGVYLALFGVFHVVARMLPDILLRKVCRVLSRIATVYGRFCRRYPRLPMAHYVTEVFEKLTPLQRELVFFDQLNPSYAKYYTRDEARALLTSQGFTSIGLYHRHKYSWSVIATRE